MNLHIGYAAVREHPTILELATKYHSTANQITLGWHLARGVAVVTASKNTKRQKENLKVRRSSSKSSVITPGDAD